MVPGTIYQVLPADYCLRGIPLGRGHHEILLEYRPVAYVVGRWVSLASLFLYLAGVILWLVRRQARRDNPDVGGPTPGETAEVIRGSVGRSGALL